MALVIKDTASGFLRQLGIIAPNYINEALSKAAFIVYEQIQSEASRYSNDVFTQYHSQKGKRGIIGSGQLRDKGLRRSATITSFGKPFERFSRTTSNTRASGAESMAKLTRWRLYDGKMKAIVGWMNTKSYASVKYKDGVAKGFYKQVKGTSLYDKKDTEKKYNIGEMMENGGHIPLSEAQKKLFVASGMAKIARRGYVIRKARPIINPAYVASRNAAERKMVEVVSKIVDYKGSNNSVKRGVA